MEGRNMRQSTRKSHWIEPGISKPDRFHLSSHWKSQFPQVPLDNNSYSGNLPPELGWLKRLQSLSVSYNLIGGQIPASLSNCTKLSSIIMSYNKLTGPLPPELGSLPRLELIAFSRNNISGSIPSTFGNLSSLMRLYGGSNDLTGEIPDSLGRLKKLELVAFGENRLTGFVPPTIFNLSYINTFDLAANQLEGTLPSYLGITLPNLQIFSLNGTLPVEIGSLKNLEYFNVSGNNFVGEIPSTLGGALPEDGVFKNASLISVSGNPKLCGGIPELKLSKCSLKQHKKSSLSLTSKIVISTFGVILGISMILSVLIVYFLKREKKEPPSNPFGRSLLNVSYQSLLQATGGFSRDNLLGVGSYGSVYKGTLEEKLVAVKVLNLSQRGALKSFMAECEALRNIRHRNLVKVLTACSGVDLQGNDFKALVYEFMPNGSLDDWLHPQLNEDLTRGEIRYLNLVQRLNIAIDIACAVEYLHLRSGTPIVHCDLKPSNVLLDDELVGRVGDFGLARFLYKATDSFSRHQTSSSLVRGTIGYTAPEYGTGSEPSTLVMYTALGSYCWRCSRLSDIADPKLLHERETGTEPSTNGLQHYSSIGNHKYEKCLVKVLRVGVACSADSAKERMSIAEV
ncbi:UNVERIFIED_CONTAM: Receptor kinase-like protein Xa21 [Sesamum radiatum]|uniref:Receptor kinase-like protein Xa21 n=1 Tax=Sesamum radiatum TaxID=300843 RepID=A0AAW2QEH3_SESRA